MCDGDPLHEPAAAESGGFALLIVGCVYGRRSCNMCLPVLVPDGRCVLWWPDCQIRISAALQLPLLLRRRRHQTLRDAAPHRVYQGTSLRGAGRGFLGVLGVALQLSPAFYSGVAQAHHGTHHRVCNPLLPLIHS